MLCLIVNSNTYDISKNNGKKRDLHCWNLNLCKEMTKRLHTNMNLNLSCLNYCAIMNNIYFYVEMTHNEYLDRLNPCYFVRSKIIFDSIFINYKKKSSGKIYVSDEHNVSPELHSTDCLKNDNFKLNTYLKYLF